MEAAMAKQGFRVMDCDIHVTEPSDLWIKYMDPEFRDRAPQRTSLPGGQDHGVWQFEGRVIPAYIDQPDRLRMAEVRREKAIERVLLLRYRSAGRETLA
jgi:hypothetical protein